MIAEDFLARLAEFSQKIPLTCEPASVYLFEGNYFGLPKGKPCEEMGRGGSEE